MKILYLAVWRNDKSGEPLQLCNARNLDDYNFFKRGTVSEFITFFSGTLAEGTKPGQRIACFLDEESKENRGHAYGRAEGICGIAVTDEEYPKRVVQGLLSKITDEFVTKYPRTAYVDLKKAQLPKPADHHPYQYLSFPELKTYLDRYQNPAEADSIMKIQKELDETKIVLHKSIEGVLERGAKIDNLVAKSEGLSASSKMFYTQAKKQNSCCVVM